MFLKNGMIVFDGDSDALLNSPIPEIRIFIKELGVHWYVNGQ